MLTFAVMVARLLALSEIAVDVGDHTYAIDAWPTQLALAGTVIVLAFLVTTFALGRRGPPAVLAGAIASLAVSGGLAWFVTKPGGGTGLFTVVVFRRAFETYAMATAAGVGATCAAIAIALSQLKERRVLGVGLGTAALGIALALLSRGDAGELKRIGRLPYFAVKGHDQLHAGHAREAEVQLVREPGTKWIFIIPTKEDGPQPYENAESWSPPKTVTVRADAPGRVKVEARAQRGPVRLTSKLTFEAKRESASPLLPLRVGNRWVYRVVHKQDSGLLFYVASTGGGQSEDRLEMEVVRAGERGGFHTFTIAVRGHGRDEEQEVVALGGQTLTLREDGTPGEPVIEADDQRGEVFSCRARLLGIAGTCQWGGADTDQLPKPPPSKKRPAARRRKDEPEQKQKLVPVRFALAGPLELRQRYGSTAGALGVGLLALMTLGTVILPHGSTATYSLVETRRGPAGAPEAPSP
jgi:hypothetical protein